MKHVIAFLGFNRSRIQHPVYRRFIQIPLLRRNAALIFQPRPLEERDLAHQVNELTQHDSGPAELTFHLCASLADATMGQQLLQTVLMIRRIYDRPTYVYCSMPDLQNCTDEERSATWASLTALSNGVSDYPELQLISHCFLYSDTMQRSLAELLYSITQQPEVLDEVERYSYIGKLVRKRLSGDVSYVPDFPRIFTALAATVTSYPEDDVAHYLRQVYLSATLALALPEHNRISMEQCNEHVKSLIFSLPLSDAQVSLCGAGPFIELQQYREHEWTDVHDFWRQSVQDAINDLSDRPREEWPQQLRNMLNVQYQTRFREGGVEHFYRRHKKLTTDYCRILINQMRTYLRQLMQQQPYPPETCLDIVHSLTNHLQQQAMRFCQQEADLTTAVQQTNERIAQLQGEWDGLGIFDRMRGRDKVIFEQLRHVITDCYIDRTRLEGAAFATKLLNELIPQLPALTEGIAHLTRICRDAYTTLRQYIDQNHPSRFIDSMFSSDDVLKAAEAIEADQVSLLATYSQLQRMLYSDVSIPDSDLLLQQLRDDFHADIDAYIRQRITDGTMPPVLCSNIVERIDALYAHQGGIAAYVEKMKKDTVFSVRMKGEDRRNEQYLLIAPDSDAAVPYIRSAETSVLRLLHLRTSISLADLDGFAGQRMFVEPSIF